MASLTRRIALLHFRCTLTSSTIVLIAVSDRSGPRGASAIICSTLEQTVQHIYYILEGNTPAVSAPVPGTLTLDCQFSGEL